MDILFFICLAGFILGIMMTISEMLIDAFNEEFNNIEKGGKNGRKRK